MYVFFLIIHTKKNLTAPHHTSKSMCIIIRKGNLQKCLGRSDPGPTRRAHHSSSQATLTVLPLFQFNTSRLWHSIFLQFELTTPPYGGNHCSSGEWEVIAEKLRLDEGLAGLYCAYKQNTFFSWLQEKHAFFWGNIEITFQLLLKVSFYHTFVRLKIGPLAAYAGPNVAVVWDWPTKILNPKKTIFFNSWNLKAHPMKLLVLFLEKIAAFILRTRVNNPINYTILWCPRSEQY
jgi:hypothetical protein